MPPLSGGEASDMWRYWRSGRRGLSMWQAACRRGAESSGLTALPREARFSCHHSLALRVRMWPRRNSVPRRWGRGRSERESSRGRRATGRAAGGVRRAVRSHGRGGGCVPGSESPVGGAGGVRRTGAHTSVCRRMSRAARPRRPGPGRRGGGSDPVVPARWEPPPNRSVTSAPRPGSVVATTTASAPSVGWRTEGGAGVPAPGASRPVRSVRASPESFGKTRTRAGPGG